MRRIIFACLTMSVLLNTACKQKSNTAQGDQQSKDTSVKTTKVDSNSVVVDPNLPPQNLKAVPVINNIVEEWAKASNAHDAVALGKIYAPKVEFYTKRVSGDQLEGFWTNYFSKEDPKFNIKVTNKKDIRTEDNGVMLALFEGHMANNTTRHYQMRMKLIDGAWKITFENYQELLEQKQRAFATPPDPKNIKSCDDAIDAVLRSSPSISGLLGQPNARRVTEFKPGDKNGPYGKYQIAVWGYRPGKDIEEKLGTFQLEVKTGELFELKEPDNKPNSVPYDMQFKKYIQKYCKSE